MKRIKRLSAVVVILALVCGLPGLAAAFPDSTGTRFHDSANYLKGLGVIVGDSDGNLYPWRTITRAEAAKIIVSIIGRADQVAAQQSVPAFSDTAGHWANGYIAVAKSLGIIDGFPGGTFRPQDQVTYAQMAKMLVAATGREGQPGLAWPQNWMTIAQALGIFTGIPSYDADQNAIRGDCVMMTGRTAQHVATTTTGQTLAQSVFGRVASFELTPAYIDAPVGSGVQLSAAPKTSGGEAVQGLTVGYVTSNRANSVVSQTGLFGSSVPGIYTVTASVAGLTETATISVYGAATGLRATPSTTQLSATGTSKATILVEVVDAGGRRVANDHATQVTMAHASGGNNGAVTLGTATKVVSSGVAEFDVTSTTSEYRTDTLEFTATAKTKAQTSIATVAQIATSIRVSAAQETLRANTITSTVVTATLLDQSGASMTGGVANLTFAISGPGTFAGGSTAPYPAVTTTGTSTVEVFSVQGSTGNITVSVTSPDLTAGQVTIVSYYPGVPAQVRVAVSDSTITATETGAGANVAKLRVELVDANGWLATRATALPFIVTLANGNPLADAGLAVIGSLIIPAGQSHSAELTIGAVNSAAGVAGTHSIKVTPGDTAYAAATLSVSVTPGPVAAINVSPGVGVVLVVTQPAATYHAQLADAAGNPVAVGGITIRAGWTDIGAPNTGRPTLNGVLNPPSDPANTAAVTGVTDAQGKAVFTFAAQGYINDSYRLLFRSGDITAVSGDILVAGQVANDLEVVFEQSGVQVSRIRADYGELAAAYVTVKDQHGNPLINWDVALSLPNGGENIKDLDVEVGSVIQPLIDGQIILRSAAGGRVGLSFRGAKAGAFPVTATVLNLAQPLVRSGSFQIDPGYAVAGVKVTTPAGGAATGLAVEANQPVELRLVPTDNGGNPIVTPIDIDVLVHAVQGLYHSGAGDGTFRLSPTGANVTSGSYIRIPRGSTSVPVFFVQSASQSSVSFGLDSSNTAYKSYELVVVLTNTSAVPTPSNVVTIEVRDAGGNAANGVRVSVTASVGTRTPATAVTGADGRFTVTWNNGATGQLIVYLEDGVLGDGYSRPQLNLNWVAP